MNFDSYDDFRAKRVQRRDTPYGAGDDFWLTRRHGFVRSLQRAEAIEGPPRKRAFSVLWEIIAACALGALVAFMLISWAHLF